jgi:glutamate synthase (NADPH/NADH) small chain
MGKATGFIEIQRKKQPHRPVEERLHDWREVYVPYSEGDLRGQASRCMDCGIPFCHQGCPLGNLIPDWNDFVYRDRWDAAIDRLHATNNFPEWTGRLCPAPCEGSCVLGINDSPVTIKAVEVTIVERAFDEGRVVARPPQIRRANASRSSDPAGRSGRRPPAESGGPLGDRLRARRSNRRLAAVRHSGVLEKKVLDRRLTLMQEEGVMFDGGATSGQTCRSQSFETASKPSCSRRIDRASRSEGARTRTVRIHFAMEYLTLQNRRCEGDKGPVISAEGKHVIIIGGGDTGADCLGTTHRQGARSVRQLELLSRPPDARAAGNPWPLWPNIFRVSSAHEEGGERMYSISTDRFTGNASGEVTTLHGSQIETIVTNGRMTFKPVAGSEFTLDADLVLLAMGFVGPEKSGLLTELGVKMTDRGTVWRDGNWMTSVPGVFTAGDMQRGQSLIVWAIAEGRSCARGVDTYLMGSSELVAPVL